MRWPARLQPSATHRCVPTRPLSRCHVSCLVWRSCGACRLAQKLVRVLVTCSTQPSHRDCVLTVAWGFAGLMHVLPW